MCSTGPPPQGIRHCRPVTNPATAECRLSGCTHDSSRWIAYFNSDRLDGRDRYTHDFKYFGNQKSAGVKSGYRGGHENLQRLLMVLSFPNVCIKNSLTGLALRLVAPFYINVTVESAFFHAKMEKPFRPEA
ncbi:hypothetical protein NPIL_687071 [Nephila pilipes]|uniref:Uncharacterized protein n=1 Tax=Nephila pilipes TaxID=299642 RepID=A0A8X6N7U2_NEPPI|nr:hypothetical protein NPIL_389441 [Nephila pilipes]GFS98329.1 hypothetical protein NPIL_393251 [Nephila pilipes]GFT87201.1 hypothetical protein NPIL_313391 [Nephila pilipes]GFU41381.1 hypothetical protein NPIL_687071 [Nephila pilipes]